MSEHVTWEVCVRCGLVAAVGWVPVRLRGARAGSRPVEFDCRAGCEVGAGELIEAYGVPVRRTPAG
ncbi:MAG TPA: hypothetical protein VFG13_17370 [Blastococcus sp.]|nr:hypothetical protein [Blastococcus sp.]